MTDDSFRADAHQAGALYGGCAMGDLIIQALRRFPGHTAFIHADRSYSYAEVAASISQAIQQIRSLGLGKGDTLVQLTRNTPHQWFVMAAVYILGLRSVTLHAMGSEDDHCFTIEDAQASAVLLDVKFANRLESYRKRCAGVKHWFVHGADGCTPDFWEAACTFTPQPLQCDSQAEDIVRLAYTGGTTGRPKGVMLSNRALVTNALLSITDRQWPQDIRVLCAAPLSHGAGALVVPMLWNGGSMVLHSSFDADAVIDAVEQHRITVMYAVPTMLYKLLDHPRSRSADWSSLKLIMYGAAPMSTARIREAIELFGPVLCQSYGQTEAPNSIAVLRPCDHDLSVPQRLASCGMPYAGIQVKVLDDACNELPVGEVGEVCVRGPIVMSGYWNQPELTAQALRGGWLHTGDMAYRDVDGYLYIVDRQKDMIISGGFNVYPREIEDVLAGHPAVSAAAVIGVPDATWGEAVKAVVVLREGASATDKELMDRVRAAKGAVHTPKSIDFVETLPLTAVGKPDKKALRGHYWSGLSRAIN